VDPITTRLLSYEVWANERALATVERSGDRRALRLMAHVIAAERVWLERLTGAAATTPVWPEWSLEEVRATAERNASELRGYLTRLGWGGLSGSITYRNSRGEQFTTAVAEVLTHLFAHGAYHRGQVAQAVRQAGHEPINTDFITFAREGGG
jgi:uncharacterized damage-inducible protein DinB